MPTIQKQLGIGLATNTIYDIIRLIFLGIFTVTLSAIASNELALYLRPLRPLRWPVIVLISSFTAWVFLLAYARWSRSRPKFTPLYFDYIVTNYEVTYIYRANKSVEYRRRKDLRALRSNLKSYVDKYHWTGKGKVNMRSGVLGSQVRRTRRRSIWQMYEIEFPALRKGQVQATEVIWDLEDTTDSVVPFISATIEEPTEKLTFHLWLEPQTGVTQIWCEVLSGIGGKSSFDSFMLPVSPTGEVVWSIPHPRLLHYYEISWDFPNRTQSDTVSV